MIKQDKRVNTRLGHGDVGRSPRVRCGLMAEKGQCLLDRFTWFSETGKSLLKESCSAAKSQRVSVVRPFVVPKNSFSLAHDLVVAIDCRFRCILVKIFA